MTTPSTSSFGRRAAARRAGLVLVRAGVMVLLAGNLTASTARDQYRSIDGSGNSLRNPLMGAAATPLARLARHAYADFVEQPGGEDRPGARAISNAIAAQAPGTPTAAGMTSFVWLWGQFVDHDLSFTPAADPPEPFDIAVPAGDPFFDPAGTGDRVISLNRSVYDPTTGTRRNNPRRQLNMITSWIDASNVYGSDTERAMALRRLDGSGELKTSRGRLLPWNRDGLDNAGGPGPDLFLAGDVRANEQIALTAMHTLWVREHNRLAQRIRGKHPLLRGEEIYERARAEVGALMQVITYKEFLPALLGVHALPEYRGWKPSTDADICQEFSTAAYRFGHSMVTAELWRLRRDGRPVAAGHLALRNSFFAPAELRRTGIEPLLRGLAAQPANTVDPMIVDELRNFLFGPPGSGGFDLASLNIQRGRDHGLDSYYEARVAFGLEPPRRFSDITSDADLAARLKETYGHLKKIDLWVGGLAEDAMPGSLLGPLFHTIVRDQFLWLRDGDRFFYRRAFSGRRLQRLESTRLADVIRRNTRIGQEISDNVFATR